MTRAPARPLGKSSRLAIAAFSCLLAPSTPSRAQEGKVLSRYRGSVARIELAYPDGRRGTGNGFFVSPDGELVTCYHVMKAAREAEISFHLADGKVLKRYQLGRCSASDTDLCVLKLEHYPERWFRLDASRAAPGAPILVLSVAPSIGLVAVEGELLGHDARSSVSLAQVSIELTDGMSGSPIVTKSGDLVGVASFSTRRFHTLVPKHAQNEKRQDFGISVAEIRRFQSKIRRFGPPEGR